MKQYDWKRDYKELCMDCLYYGYGWNFIRNQYPHWIEEYGEAQCKAIYDSAHRAMCRF